MKKIHRAVRTCVILGLISYSPFLWTVQRRYNALYAGFCAQAFPFRDREQKLQRVRWYDYLIVDEACQKADEYFSYVELHLIQSASTRHKMSKTVFCGDPYQLDIRR